MTVLIADAGEMLADILRVAGLAFCLAMVYHVLTIPKFMRGKAMSMVFHVIFGIVSAFFVFVFVIGVTYSKGIRWFTVFGLLIGSYSYYLAFRLWMARLINFLYNMSKYFVRLLINPFVWVFGIILQWIKLFSAFASLLFVKLLKKPFILLYNFVKLKNQKRKELRANKTRRKRAKNEKVAVKAYSKT